MNDEVTAPIPQIAPVIDHPALIKLREDITSEIEHQLSKSVASEVARQLSNDGDVFMSGDKISKDWVERRLSELDNKLNIQDIQNESKLERIIAASDAKFASNLSEIKIGFSQIDAKLAHVEAKIDRSEMTLTRWGIGLAISAVALTIAITKAYPTPPAQGTHPVSTTQTALHQ